MIVALSCPKISVQPRTHRPCAARRQVVVEAMKKPTKSQLIRANFRRGPLDDIGSYISEAFAQIFSGLDEAEQVPWIEQPAFSGSITHHEIGNRHGHAHHSHMYHEGGFEKKYEVIREDDLHGDGPLGWVTDSIGRSFFGTNLNDHREVMEPKRFYSTGYTGRKASARRIRREVDRLGRH